MEKYNNKTFRGRGGFRGGRGTSGRGFGRDSFPRDEGNYPVASSSVLREEPAPSVGARRQPPKNIKREIKTTDPTPDDLRPKALSATGSVEKNDPLIQDAILFDGISGFVQRTMVRQFQIDMSPFESMVRASYNAQITFDRGFKKYVSFGMYHYYCAVLLWRRLLFIVAQRGPMALDYEKLSKYLNFDTPEPSDVSMYLSGIGDIDDFSSRRFELSLQGTFGVDICYGAQGFFGQVSPETIHIYETMVSLGVALLKIRADLQYTRNPEVGVQWDLPAGLRPTLAAATFPNANLLGWSPAETLTQEQQGALEDANFTLANMNVVNIAHFPINQTLVKYVAGMIQNSKCVAISPMSTSVNGSVAQVPFSIRSPEDKEISDLVPVATKVMKTSCYCQASAHIAGASAVFRYRISRRPSSEYRDSLGYRFTGTIPAEWYVHEQDVFNHGAPEQLWNIDQYRIAEQEGSGLATAVANRVRRKVTKT